MREIYTTKFVSQKTAGIKIFTTAVTLLSTSTMLVCKHC